MERCGGSRRNIRVITTTAPVAGLGLGASGIIYLALHGDVLAGYLADYEVGTSLNVPSIVCSDLIAAGRRHGFYSKPGLVDIAVTFFDTSVCLQ